MVFFLEEKLRAIPGRKEEEGSRDEKSQSGEAPDGRNFLGGKVEAVLVHCQWIIKVPDMCAPTFTSRAHSSQKAEIPPLPINRGMDKQKALHPYNGILLIQKEK